jgi:signal transduction histidine kinase
MGVGGSSAGDASLPSYQDADAQEIIDEVTRTFISRLAALNSALLQDADTLEQLYEQVRSTILEVLARTKSTIDPAPQSTSLGATGPFLSIVGASRAYQGIHPAESLRAAGELFDVALPIIVRHRGFQGTEIPLVSQRLHQAIINRVALASLPYVESLLAKLHSYAEKERHRISRELHDSVGHEIALSRQHFDMYRYFSGNDREKADHEFMTGLSSLDEALRTVRHLSTELRRSVDRDGIQAAIDSYLRNNVPVGIQASLQIIGDAKILPASINEELYMIMREACRNALRHGQPSEIRLTMMITESEVTAAISDNGCGFSAGALDNPACGGMQSMTERVELLNGLLEVESTVGEGTTITARVPLSNRVVL